MIQFSHAPAMLNEIMEMLRVEPGGVYLDGTVGGGGHAKAIAEAGGRVIGIDRDDAAVEVSTARLKVYGATIVKGNFNDACSILDRLNIDRIDGAVLDLGVSSHQFDEGERGFSYRFNAPLDMRMDRETDITARDIVNRCSQAELEKILFHYGEETHTRKIVQKIMFQREIKPIETTFELVNIIKSAIPVWSKHDGKHPAKRTFQAIRIAVNDELSNLDKAVSDISERLRPGGRLAVVTFHSLEDRIIKNQFAYLASRCVCPPDFPECVCKKRATCEVVTRKPVTASQRELHSNPRVSSAKLRVIERVEE